MFLAIAFYIAAAAAVMAQMWYLHKFFDDESKTKKTAATRYLSVFYLCVFILLALTTFSSLMMSLLRFRL